MYIYQGGSDGFGFSLDQINVLAYTGSRWFSMIPLEALVRKMLTLKQIADL